MKKLTAGPLIYTLFLFSGISGLVYQIVWLRMFSRILGSTVYATSIVVASFMAGMAIGSYYWGRRTARSGNLLLLYSVLEVGVGLSVLLLSLVFAKMFPLYKFIYSLAGEQRLFLTAFQAILLFSLLLIPTALMGGTLPVLAAHTRKYGASFDSRLGLLYGVNTLGAMLGVLGSGLYTIGAFGERATIALGIFINLAVAIGALLLSRAQARNDAVPSPAAPRDNGRPANSVISQYPAPVRAAVLWAYAVSGFVAMAYEIVWSRLFQIQVGSSVYAFSMVLAVYLAGITLGSLLESRILGDRVRPLAAFGWLQLFISIYGLLGLYVFTWLSPVNIIEVIDFKIMVTVPLLIVFPVTFALGLLFPIASRIYVRSEETAGRQVGTVYSLNTLGCILGALLCGFALIPLFGIRLTVLQLSGLSLLLGGIPLFLDRGPAKPAWTRFAVAGVALAILAGLAAAAPDPFMSMVKKRLMRKLDNDLSSVEFYYHKESVSATTTALGIRGNPLSKRLWINGIGMTVLCNETKVMAHLPILLHREPEDLLVVCFGMGTTARSALVHRTLRCDAVELVPETYQCFKYFHRDGPAILADPRFRNFADDGRNFLLMRSKKYDIITMDPAPPLWSAGTVNLYSREFFELCRRRLNQDGIMMAWLPSGNFSECRMIMATFKEVFPNSYVFGTSGLYLIGLKGEGGLNPERFYRADSDPEIIRDLTEYNHSIPRPSEILNQLILDPFQFSIFASGARIISDDHPYTEFPLERMHNDRSYNWLLDAKQLIQWRDNNFDPSKR
jgi:spermidine synthase